MPKNSGATCSEGRENHRVLLLQNAFLLTIVIFAASCSRANEVKPLSKPPSEVALSPAELACKEYTQQLTSLLKQKGRYEGKNYRSSFHDGMYKGNPLREFELKDFKGEVRESFVHPQEALNGIEWKLVISYSKTALRLRELEGPGWEEWNTLYTSPSAIRGGGTIAKKNGHIIFSDEDGKIIESLDAGLAGLVDPDTTPSLKK